MKKIYFGIVAAIISAVSDILLLYHPQLISKYDHYTFLFEIDRMNNTLGWVMGMIFLPALYIGYKGVKSIADENSRKVLDKNDWLVVFLIASGCVVHSVYHFFPIMHMTNPVVDDTEIRSVKLIEIIFVSFYLLFCGIITIQSFNKKNNLLYKNRFFNPLIWIVFSTIVFAITPQFGGYLIVSAFNLSIGFYFGGMIMCKK